MNENQNAKKNTAEKKKHKEKKHYTVLPYFKKAILYVLVSMIVFVPVSALLMSRAVSTVHKAQTVMTKTANELELDNSYEKSDYSQYLEKISIGKRLGTISCESAGICENVYYGINRACMRNGAGLNSNSYLFGEGGCTQIAAYPSSSFARLGNVSVGDTVNVDTFWGSFEYRVISVEKSENVSVPEYDSIILAAFDSSKPFAAQDEEKIYVTAELVNKEVS